MTDIDIAVHPPDPTYLSIVAAVIRGVLQIASGLGFGWATFVTGDQVTMIATATVMVLTLFWSAWQKVRAVRRRQVAAEESAALSAVASAQAGEPVEIVVANPKMGAA